MNNRVTKTYRQTNYGTPEEIFPLLCPVREADWLDGWQYSMIYSESGVAEQDCVFSTPHHGENDTIWFVTEYDPANYRIGFVRTTPGESFVNMHIALSAIDETSTAADITYQYTALNDAQQRFINTELDAVFHENMLWWEKSINHYLQTGEKLLSED